MQRFRTFLKEMAAVNIADLNTEFLKRAQKVTSFNLQTKDFESLQYKAEIQHLFNMHFFPDFDLDNTIKGDIKMDVANKLIKQLKSEDKTNFNKLHYYNLKGVGPGEATLYFLCDKAMLGGGASAGVDIIIAGKKYEVKAANYSKNTGTLTGFKLGGTVPLGDMVTKAVEMKNMMGLKTQGKGQNEVNTSQIDAIRKKFPADWKKIEIQYGRAAAKYFGNTPVIFINNNGSGGRLTADGGEIVTIKKVGFNDIQIHTITQGTIKPRVKV
tara:strand:+ start:194 stop:1000 length:807 start_codon:yes stop_codon:yes gene_type:complete